MATIVSKSVGIHDGPFHADEVSAVALLCVFGRIDRDKIRRTRDFSILETCEYICDVGGIYDPANKRFDHHQIEYQGTLSSAGMVLCYLEKEGDLTEDEGDFLRKSLIDGVDAHDNGRIQPIPGVTTFSQLVANFMPISYDAEAFEIESGFYAALDFVIGHLERSLARHRYGVECREIVAETMKGDKRVLIFEHQIPWQESFFVLGGETHPAKFVIMPAGNHWKLRAIPPTLAKRMSVRLPMPESWAGLLKEELKEVSGIEGAIFCHKGRFISVWKTKADALKALERIFHDNGI